MLREFSFDPLTRLNHRMAIGLAVFVALASTPMASNRSVWWLIWTAGLALAATLHLLRAAQLEPRRRPRFLRFGAAFALAAIVPVYAVIQSLPIAGVLPAAFLRMRSGLEGLAGQSISVQPDVALAGALRFVGFLLLLALVLEVATRRERVQRMGMILLAGVVLQAIWALVALRWLGDFSLWGPKTAYQGVATGTFVNRNSLAAFLALGLVLGVGLLIGQGSRDRARLPKPPNVLARMGFGEVFILLGLVTLLLALIATQSRLGLAAAIAGVGVTLVLARMQSRATAARLMVEALLSLVAMGVALLLYLRGEGVMVRLLAAQGDGQNRMALYRQTLEMVSIRPVTGFGFDAFGAAFEAFRTPPLLSPGNFDLAHNSYLMLWSELGVIVGSIPMVLLAAAAGILWRKLKEPHGFPGMTMAAQGALTVGAVHSAGDFSLEVPAVTYLFVTILGLGLGRSVSRSKLAQVPDIGSGKENDPAN